MLKIGNSEILKIYAGNTEITKAFLGAEQVYPSSTPPTPTDFSGLTFEIQSDGEVKWVAQYNNNTRTIEYSKNGGAWTSITSSIVSSAPSISVVSGDTLQLRGYNTEYGADIYSVGSYFSSTCQFKAKGNIMSLVDGDNYSGLTSFTSGWTFAHLFQFCTGLTDVSELLLPATGLTEGCYGDMFRNCTSIVTAPILPATTLANNCYRYMFMDCTSLSAITCLAEDITASNCTYTWVSGVSQTGYFSGSTLAGWTLDSVNGVPIGWGSNLVVDYKSMSLTFNIISGGTIYWVASDTAATKTIEYKLNDGEWTSITSDTGSSAPSITVSTGDKVMFKGDNASYGSSTSIYSSFSGSTAGFEVEGNTMSLIDSTGFATATTFTNDYALIRLFTQCTGLTSAENLVLPATSLTQYCYNSMFWACTSLTTPPELPATTLASYCYRNMFQNCSSLTTAPALPATTLKTGCYYQMFRGCTSLTTAPELPAASLAPDCYNVMFTDCSSLNYIKCLATNISARNCTYYWVNGVASSGTFVKNPNMGNWTTGINGIPPYGWTVQNAS